MTNTPTTVQELYDLLLQHPDLCGTLAIETNGCLRWDLWDGYCLSIGLNKIEAYVAMEKANRFRWQITHWHTDHDDILEELLSIGRKGSLLVVRRGWFGESVTYFGPGEECPRRTMRKGLFSRPLILKAQ